MKWSEALMEYRKFTDWFRRANYLNQLEDRKKEYDHFPFYFCYINGVKTCKKS